MWFRHLFDGKVELCIHKLQKLDQNEIRTTFVIQSLFMKTSHFMIFHIFIRSHVTYMNANVET